MNNFTNNSVSNSASSTSVGASSTSVDDNNDTGSSTNVTSANSSKNTTNATGSTDISSMLISKVCHDLANTLSTIVFIKEDINDGTIDDKTGIKELINSTENLSLRLSFFQNIVVSGKHIKSLYDILTDLCNKHNIKFEIQDLITQNEDHPFYEENIICGIIYMLVSAGIKQQSFNTIKLMFSNNKIVINVPDLSIDNVPSDILDVTSIDPIQPSIVNIFAVYIRNLFTTYRYTAFLKAMDGVSIVICKL